MSLWENGPRGKSYIPHAKTCNNGEYNIRKCLQKFYLKRKRKKEIERGEIDKERMKESERSTNIQTNPFTDQTFITKLITIKIP